MSANIIESFFVSLGFEINTEKLEEFKNKAEDLRESVLKLGTIATGAAVGIGLLVEKVAGSMGDLYSFAELNEISARSVQALSKIAIENDGSMEGMKSTIQSLNKVVGEAALGIGRGAMTFKKLGLSAKNADGSVKTVDDALSDIADKMQGLSRQEQIAMAEKLGIDPQFVKVLEQGSENLARLREEADALNPFTEQDYKLADEVDKLFIKAKNTVGVFTKILAVSLMPTVKEVLKNYLEWFKASRKATSGAFVTALKLMASAVGTLWDWVVRLVGRLKNVYDWLMKFKFVTYLATAAIAAFIAVKTYDFFIQLGGAIKLLTLRMATFNATALIIPAIIGSIILAIGLLIDDYVNWKEGNDSVIGGLIEQFPMLLGFIEGLESGVSDFIDFWLQQWATLEGPITELGSAIWDLVSVVASLLWPVIQMVFTGWAYIAAAVIPILSSLIEWIAEKLVGAIKIAIESTAWLAKAFAKVFNGIKTGIDTAIELFTTAKEKVLAFADTVAGALGKVGELLGLTNEANKVNMSIGGANNSPSAQATANNSLNARGGVIGAAGSNTSNSSSVTNTTHVSGTTININSPDPAKAGEAVKNELGKMNKQTIRNGQTAVGL